MFLFDKSKPYGVNKRIIKKSINKNYKHNKMNKPKLTIIIPAYNEINTIQKLIDKISNLKIDKQIILIDDNSKDGTSEVVKK